MRIGLYADGNYFCKCAVCSETFHGDKRAVQCLRCAATEVQAALDKANEEIKRLRNKVGICNWRYDDVHDMWETGCGNAYCFTDGTPKDKRIVFCPYCGKILKENTPCPSQ